MAARVWFAFEPESLLKLSYNFVLMNLEHFEVGDLSSLPFYIRKKFLWELPLADVSRRLDGTSFTLGQDMARYWKYPLEKELFDVNWWLTEEEICVANNWKLAEYERSVLYGLLITLSFGNDSECLREGNISFQSPLSNDLDAVSLLYAVKIPTEEKGCELIFPPRYSHMSGKGRHEVDTDDVILCFGRQRGELPKVFPEVFIANDSCMNYMVFFCGAILLHIQGSPMECLQFVKTIIQNAPSLEILILNQCGDEDETHSLEDFYKFLASQRRFLARLRHLKVHSTVSQLHFSVSRRTFNNLITAYYSTPVGHMQRLDFSHTKIMCNDVSQADCGPIINRFRYYLRFKEINFDDHCQFISKFRVAPASITHWLGPTDPSLRFH